MHYSLRTAILTLFLCLCCFIDVHAQESKPAVKESWSFGMNGYYGALFRYRSGNKPLNFTHPFGLELYANRHTTGRRQWEQQYKHPQLGFSLSYYNYGVPDELGEAVALTTQLDNRITNLGKGSLRFNVGTGVVYSTRYYTPEVNEYNKAIGSPVAFSLQSTLRYEHPLDERLFLNLNLAFRHFSNGGLNKPNNGMNFPLLGLGIRYQPQKVSYLQVPDTASAVIDKRLHLNLRLARGVKEVLRIDTKHPVYAASLYASKRLTKTNSLLIGMDVMFDTALREEYINKSLPIPEGEIESRMAGITLGHELHFDLFSIMVQFGRYLYMPHEQIFPRYYQRYGIHYRLTKNLSANATLMAHTRTANVIEWGLGFHL